MLAPVSLNWYPSWANKDTGILLEGWPSIWYDSQSHTCLKAASPPLLFLPETSSMQQHESNTNALHQLLAPPTLDMREGKLSHNVHQREEVWPPPARGDIYVDVSKSNI